MYERIFILCTLLQEFFFFFFFMFVVFGVVCGCEGKGALPPNPEVFRIGCKLRRDQPVRERKVPEKFGTSRSLLGGLISQLASPANPPRVLHLAPSVGGLTLRT